APAPSPPGSLAVARSASARSGTRRHVSSLPDRAELTRGVGDPHESRRGVAPHEEAATGFESPPPEREDLIDEAAVILTRLQEEHRALGPQRLDDAVEARPPERRDLGAQDGAHHLVAAPAQ